MINEEIEKRFLFDLEMGIFKKDPQSGVTVFRTWDLKSFVTILEILDKTYKPSRNYNAKAYINDRDRLRKIYIDVNKKIYYLHAFDVPEFGYTTRNDNDVPDYIPHNLVRSYSLWLMKKLKRDSYLI